MTPRFLAIAASAALLTAGCNDVVTQIGPENDPTVTNEVGTFRYEAHDLDDVHEEFSFIWQNPGTQAKVLHRGFVPHGSNIIVILDADGTEVYRHDMLFEVDDVTAVGVPGAWTVEFLLHGTTGRIDMQLETLP
jgi:hypothetical protein